MRLLGTLVSTAMVMLGADAALADGKNWPGANCVQISGGSPTYTNGAIGNASTTSTLRLECPATKDAGKVDAGWVRMKDGHTSQDVTCRLNVAYTNGSGFSRWFSPMLDANGYSSNYVQKGFSSDVSANAYSHYSYSCSLPPRQSGRTSYIATYHVKEKG